MKQSDRILKIIDLLKSSHWLVLELANRFEVSTRTIFRDFAILREMGYELDSNFQDRFFIVTDLRKDIDQSIKLLKQITQSSPHKLLTDSIENIEAFKI